MTVLLVNWEGMSVMLLRKETLKGGDMDLVSMSFQVSTAVSCFRNIILCIIIWYCALFIVNNIVKPPESDSPKCQDLVVTYGRCSGHLQNQTNDVYFEKSSYTSTFWERIYCTQFVSYCKLCLLCMWFHVPLIVVRILWVL